MNLSISFLSYSWYATWKRVQLVLETNVVKGRLCSLGRVTLFLWINFSHIDNALSFVLEIRYPKAHHRPQCWASLSLAYDVLSPSYHGLETGPWLCPCYVSLAVGARRLESTSCWCCQQPWPQVPQQQRVGPGHLQGYVPCRAGWSVVLILETSKNTSHFSPALEASGEVESQ